MSAEDDSQGFRRVLIYIDLVRVDEDGDELQASDWAWCPHIVFDLGERDPETELRREAAVDFATFNEAFAWVFHEMALACLELQFAGPAPPPASKFPQRVPSLSLTTDSGVRQVFAWVRLVDIQISDRALEAWTWFVDIHFDDGQVSTLEFLGTEDIADAVRTICESLEVGLPNSTSTSLTYPRSEAVFTGDGLNQAPKELPEDLDLLESETIFEDEEVLEDHLAANPHQLYDDLWLVGRQLQIGTKKADLVGVDGHGALVVAELKHGRPDREALGQVIEYAGFLSHMSFTDLSRLLTSQTPSSDIETITGFTAAYRERYGSPPSAGVPVRPAIVSTGLDQYTVRSIAYLRDAGLPLDFFWIQECRVANGPAIVVHRNPRFEFAKQWYAPPNLRGRNRRK